MPGSSAKDDFDLRRQLSAEKLTNPNGEVGATESISESANEEKEKGELETALQEQKVNEVKKPELCACWCTGWAEIYVRRPSGDVSWMCRIQNSSLTSDSHVELPLADLTQLMQPSMAQDDMIDILDPSKRINVDNLTDAQYDEDLLIMDSTVSC